MGLTVLVASDNSTLVTYTHGQYPGSTRQHRFCGRRQRESTLAIYESRMISSTWCITQQVNPLSATESVVSDFLLHFHTEKQLAISNTEGYQMAIASTLHATSDVEVGRNQSLKSLLQNIELEQG